MRSAILLFLLVYALNVIPAFAPPTWMVFSLIGFRYPAHEGMLLALVGACAATLGRISLAKLAYVIVRGRFLSESTRANIEAIREKLEKRRKLTFGVFLFYALTPLPSNYLFIAYGLTGMGLSLIAVPFFLGRVVSYRLWAFTASTVARKLSLESTEAMPYLGGYFVVSQILLLFLVYAFTKIDWRVLFKEKKLRWIATGSKSGEGQDHS
jgi:hypothetical protein